VLIDVSLEALQTTEFNEIFSGSGVGCWWFGATKPPAHTTDGDEVSSRNEKLHILTRLSARGNFIECTLTLPQTTKMRIEFTLDNEQCILN
jgi:hypothetical protein